MFKRTTGISDYFDQVARDPDVVDIVAQLVGADVRLYGGKMNLKSAGYGAPVEWHQDWAFIRIPMTTFSQPVCYWTIAMR